MRDLDRLAQRHAAAVRASVAGSEPPPSTSLRAARSARARWGPIMVAAASASAVAVVFTFSVIVGGGDPEPSSPQDPSARTPFVPPSREDGDSVEFAVTLLDGAEIVVSLPRSLAGEVAGFVPGGAVGWEQDLCCSRTLDIAPGTVGDLYGDREPDEVYADAAGRGVGFYTDPDDVDHLVFQFGSWVVRAWDGGPGPGERFTPAARERFASLLDGFETPDGFLVLRPVEPMTVMKADAPDGTLVGHDGSPVVGVIMGRECPGTARTAGPGHSFTVSRDAGVTVVCSWRDAITLVVHRTGIDLADVNTIAVEPVLERPPFDLEGLLASKLYPGFGDADMRVGVVVLVPEGAAADVEALLDESILEELDGFVRLGPDAVAEHAERFAFWERTRPLEGRWVAYGLMPRFMDTTTGGWESVLRAIGGARVARVDFAIGPVPGIPDEWTVIGDLPFRVTGGAIIRAIDAGVVVVQRDTTFLVRPDGSWDSSDAPVHVPAGCCGGATGLAAGSTVVLLGRGGDDVWILDPVTLHWREADRRPASQSVLGSALLDGELFVVTTDGRLNLPSTVAALDLATGTWREMEAVPAPISVGGVASDGERLFVAGVRQDGNNRIIGGRQPRLFEFTAIGGWRSLPDIPIDGQAATIVWVDGAGLLAWNYDLESALLDATGSWRRLGNVPMPFCECYPGSVATAGGAAAGGLYVAWFEAPTERWHPIRLPSGDSSTLARFAVTPTAIVAFADHGDEGTRMVALPLPPPSR